MKNLNKPFIMVLLLTAWFVSLGISNARALPPPSDFTVSVINLTQPTDRTIEFDVYILDTDASQPFELASVQLGFLLNSTIYSGGSLTAAIDNTGSGLLATQQFSAAPGIVTSLAGYPGQTLLRLAGRTPPGAGNGTIISSTGNGTLLTHFILTSTVAWATSTTADLVFTSSAAMIPLYATRVSQYIANINTALVVTPGTNALVCCNPQLNVVPPSVFNVTGGGAYCEGGAGLPVGLSGSEITASYQLYKDGAIEGAPLTGTGSALSFGNKTAGTYTVMATNVNGTLLMNGSAVITANPLPLQPGAFTTSMAVVYQGATGIPYTVPNDPTVTYSWTYSGTGATINGTSNSVTISYSASATSGTLSVTATNGCGTSTAQSMAITVNSLLPSDYSISVLNLTQPTDRTIEFDVYLLDTDPVQPLEMATVQLGFLLNSGIYTGGTLTAAISNTGSGLIASQQFTALPTVVSTIAGYPGLSLLRLAGRTPPGAGNGSIISSIGSGTLLTHFVLTSTVPWTFNSTADLVFTSSAVVNPLYATRISAYIGTTNTALTVTPGINALICCNPPLNLSLPLAFDVLGSGSYCQGTGGLLVSLSGSEIGVTYTMHGGPLPEPSVDGTGSAISFGIQPAGVYTVSGTGIAGTTAMNGSAVITENPSLPAAVSIAADFTTVCAGTTVNFTATPVNGGASPTISWYKNTVLDGTGLTYSYVPANGDAVYAVMDADPTLLCVTGSPATSNTVNLTVNSSLPAGISIAADFTTVCAGTSVNFTATPVNGGASPTISWYKNTVLDGTGLTYSYVPANGDAVYAVMDADPTLLCVTGSPATSNTVILTVNSSLPAGISIAADFTTVCAGTTVNFTATPVNGGASPTISWYKNTVLDGTGLTYSYVPANGDAVYAVMDADPTLLCVTGSPATSNTVNLTVNSSLPAGISIAADFTTVCAGTTVNFTATPVNGGASPTISWYKNTVLDGTGLTYSYVPLDGDAVYAMMDVDPTLLCVTGSPATSNTVNLIVNPSLPASISIAADFTTVCAGTTVNFTATPINGGASPTISWYKNTVLDGTGLTYSYVPLDGDAVYAIMDADPTLLCVTGSPATSNTVNLTVNPSLPAAVSIAADFTTVCAGTTVNFTATPANGGVNPTISWYKNTVLDGTGLTYSYIPIDGDAVYAMMDADPTLLCVTGSPATSNTINLIVNPSLPAGISIAADLSTVCAGTTVNFTATPVNGGANPIISWYKNTVLNGTGLTYSYVPLDGDAVYAIMDVDPTLLCSTGSPATSNTVILTVNSSLPASISIAASANPVNAGTTVNFTATPINGGASPIITWYKNAVADGTGLTYSMIPVNGDAVYAIMDSDPSLLCVTGSPATSNTITMTVNPVLTPTTIAYSGSQTVQYYGTTTVSATLKDNRNKAISGQTILFTIGTQSATAVTNNKGFATTTLPITLPVASYQVTASYSGNATYTGSSDTHPFSVTRKPVTASLTGTVTKVYDGNAIAYMLPANYLLNGAIAGDDVSLNNPATGTYNNKNVGTGKKVTVTGLALTGTAAANYILSNTTATAFIGIITPLKSSGGIEPAIVAADKLPEFRAWPNPFTEQLHIEFYAETDTRAQLELFDMTGNKLAVLYSGNVEAGQKYNVTYIPAIGGSQMIIYRLVLGSEIRQGKLIFLDK